MAYKKLRVVAPSRRAAYRELAVSDLDSAVRWYAREAGARTAERFIDAAGQAEVTALEFPGLGSTRFASLVKPFELRALPLQGFPYVYFYLSDDTGIDVIRVLHGAQDIPEHLR